MKTKLVLFIKRNKKDLTLLFLLSVISVIFYSNKPINGDEGVILSGAWHILNGKTLYFDFFEKIAPGSFYFIYFLFKFFGVYYFVAKIVSTILLIISSFLIYKSASLIKKSNLNFLPAIVFTLSFYLLPIINHNFYNIFFIIISTYLFLWGIKTNKNIFYLWAGFFSGISIIFLQHKGLIFWGASGLFLLFLLLKNQSKKSLYQIILYSLGSIIPVVLVLLKWPIKVVYENLFLSPLNGYLEVNEMPYYIIASFVMIFVYFCIYLINDKNKKINYLLFIQLFLLLSCLPLPDFYHLYLASFPLLILSPIIFGKKPQIINQIFVIILWALFLLVTSLNMMSCPLFGNSDENIKEIIEIIENNCPNNYIYSGPFSPNLYFELKKLNATPFNVLIEKEYSPEQFDMALESFKTNSPDCAILIYYPNIKNHFKHSGNNALENYIRENYKLINLDQYIFIYKKNEN